MCSNKTTVYWEPVSRNVPGYYDKIRSTISLSEIRDKIAMFEYDTAQAMLDDVMLMVSNAECFWGKESDYAKTGRKMVNNLKKLLMHEKNTLGAEFDSVLKNYGRCNQKVSFCCCSSC